MATVVAVAAAFTIWSFLPVQPGTVTALATLFVIAPAIGIAAGIVVALRTTRPAAEPRGEELAGSRGWLRWLTVGFAAVVGWIVGQSVGLVAIDLSYPHRLIDPGSAPDWASATPTAAGATLAAVMALVALAWSRPAAGDR